MSDSNWRRSYTIGLIVVGIAAAIFAYWLWSSTEAQHFVIEQQAAEGAEAYADPRNIAVEGECLALPEAERNDCITTEREASYEGQRKEGDLESQRVMAAWTRAIGIATIIGMAFGIFGLSLIFVTFRETRRAADAGQAANEIATRIGEAQVRAHLNVQTHTPIIYIFEGEGQLAQLSGNGIAITNVGNTVADRLRLWGEVVIELIDGELITKSLPEIEERSLVVNDSHWANSKYGDIEFTAPETETIAEGVAGARLECTIEFRDVFENIVTISVRSIFSPNDVTGDTTDRLHVQFEPVSKEQAQAVKRKGE